MSAEPRLAGRRGAMTPFADRPRRETDPLARGGAQEPKMPPPAKSDSQSSAEARKGEPDLSFLNRPKRERKDLDSLLSANDRRGGLAAEDLRKSLEADRSQEKTTIVKKAAKSAEPAAVEQDADDFDDDVIDEPREAAAEKPRKQTVKKKTADRPRARRDDKSSLIVGSAIRIADGRITSCDSLIVDGHMEANLDNARILEITEAGTFYGSAKVDMATIDGAFEGELTVSGRLVITASGRVSGKIRYARIEIEPGGVILGDLGSLPDN